MPKPKKNTGEKNLISKNLIEYRKQRKYSQRLLAYKLQLNGYDIDKNVITRIETNNRYVTDIELKALCEVLDVTYDELIDGSIGLDYVSCSPFRVPVARLAAAQSAIASK